MSRPKDSTETRQVAELLIADARQSGASCDVAPGCHCWVVQIQAPDARALWLTKLAAVLSTSDEELNETSTATKLVTNLTKRHPRLQLETWSALQRAAVVGRRDSRAPGAPKTASMIRSAVKSKARLERLVVPRDAARAHSGLPPTLLGPPPALQMIQPAEPAFHQPSASCPPQRRARLAQDCVLL